MNVCGKFPCGMNMTTGTCNDLYCPMKAAFPLIPANPSPRYLPVNIPFSNIGITVVTLDGYGNVQIKVDEPYPAAVSATGEPNG